MIQRAYRGNRQANSDDTVHTASDTRLPSEQAEEQGSTAGEEDAGLRQTIKLSDELEQIRSAMQAQLTASA